MPTGLTEDPGRHGWEPPNTSVGWSRVQGILLTPHTLLRASGDWTHKHALVSTHPCVHMCTHLHTHTHTSVIGFS